MKRIVMFGALIIMTGGAYAGTAVNDLGTAVGITPAETSVQAPSAPEAAITADDEADAKSFCHRHHNNLPGCAGFCKKYPTHPTCKKDKEVSDEAAYDEGLAKANCAANPNAPGCPLFCKDHHAYPGCPMFCQLNPLNPACKKSVDEDNAEEAVTAADEEDAKGRCSDHHNNLPGCPGFCARHQEHRACALPFHCRNNMTLYGCKKHCQMYPHAIGCRKGVEEKSAEASDELFDPELARTNCATNPNAPGCPLYCNHHHAYPGCPLYCQLNPMSPACGHIPAYCNTNPNGYGCPKSVEADEDTKGVPGYPNPPHPQYCQHHHGLPSCH